MDKISIEDRPAIRRESCKTIAEFSGDEVVGITTFRRKLIIATKKGVYMYPPDKKRGNNGKMGYCNLGY